MYAKAISGYVLFIQKLVAIDRNENIFYQDMTITEKFLRSLVMLLQKYLINLIFFKVRTTLKVFAHLLVCASQNVFSGTPLHPILLSLLTASSNVISKILNITIIIRIRLLIILE